MGQAAPASSLHSHTGQREGTGQSRVDTAILFLLPQKVTDSKIKTLASLSHYYLAFSLYITNSYFLVRTEVSVFLTNSFLLITDICNIPSLVRFSLPCTMVVMAVVF